MSRSLYDFVYRGVLTEESLDKAGRQTRAGAEMSSEELASALNYELLDPETY